MRKLTYAAVAACALIAAACAKTDKDVTPDQFVRIDGQYLIEPNGDTLFIRGTNLGNWLNPEGYMFGFNKTNSPRMINDMLSQLIGPDGAADFWAQFKDAYITRADIEFIANTGANTVRMPFHYKLFTDQDYMGLSANQDGFARIDSVVEWCRDNGLYLILDMHDAPGGQTGDNIDDSYGYPWLMVSEASQQQFVDIWRKIADRYKNEPVILGYELINEPIATYFEAERDMLNSKLEPLHKRAVEAIRQVDKNHIVLLGAPQWNSNFEPFTDWTYDDKIMYTCHRYGGDPTPEAIGNFIAFRDTTNLPMYMGEIGHNTDEWQAQFCETMVANNIGYTFWPYKKLEGSCMNAVKVPDGWEHIKTFSEAPRSTYAEIRAARAALDTVPVAKILNDYLSMIKTQECIPQEGYIKSMQLSVPEK